MKSLIKWAVENSPAMNTLMAALLILGALGMGSMRREVFPEFDLEIILVSVPYPGASPGEVEEGICQKLEEAVRSLSGIKKQTSVAREGGGFLVLELENYVKNPQKLVNEVRSEVDQVKSRLPENSEDPEIQQLTIREAAIRLGVIAPSTDTIDSELRLRDVAERVRDDLLQLPTVSQVNLVGVKDYQIDVEISEDTLRKYGLSLNDVANIIRRENIELPGGVIKTESQEVLLRGKNKGLTGAEIERIPIVTRTGGVVLTVGDLGVVRDEFTDDVAINEINGRSAVVLSVDRTASEDLLKIVAEVKDYASRAVELGRVPPGYELITWQDRSIDVRDRMMMLLRNGYQGLILVFLVLAVFLDLRLAFWVAIGIPVSVLGAGAYLWLTGETLNMLTMFAFLMALGIVVDDAIVIGENIHEHRLMGKPFAQAAVDGAYEVIPSVLTSVGTTVIAFLPLLFVAGVMGKFIAVMPVAVIAMLLISLAESTFVLPCHLAHEENLFLRILSIVLYPFRIVGDGLIWVNKHLSQWMDYVIAKIYAPALSWSIHNPGVVIASGVTLILVAVGVVRAGITPFVLFPKLDSNWIQAKIVYPDGTPGSLTDAATQRLADALDEVNKELSQSGESLVVVKHRTVGQVTGAGPQGPESRTSGSHVGAIEVELLDTSLRKHAHSNEILRLWRERAGEFPNAESVVFGTPAFGPGGAAIEFKLLARTDDMEQLENAVEQIKQKLGDYEGVFDIRDDSTPGKWEFQFNIKERAKALGRSAGDLAETVRAAYYGAEVMRLQRGRHEVKLMVRYPRDERRSFASFNDIRVPTPQGGMVPLTELAEVKTTRGYSEINRIDQLRSITITADVDEASGANAARIVADLQENWMPENLPHYPGVSVRWEGQAEQNAESMRSMVIGLGIAILAMFVLLTLEFRSYLQPILVLMIIPFGFVGAVLGHMIMGIPLTIFTMFGFVALTGVVVNDSIVLIDFINHRVHDGITISQAIEEAGQRRFRPVFLTSITTIAGLLPLLTETSFQAQILIPMAATLAFGLLVATPLILFLVPTFYSAYVHLVTPVSIHETLPEHLRKPKSAGGEEDAAEQASWESAPILDAGVAARPEVEVISAREVPPARTVIAAEKSSSSASHSASLSQAINESDDYLVLGENAAEGDAEVDAGEADHVLDENDDRSADDDRPESTRILTR
ncbi:MAG: efflux RND transporter permease subunit [Planctomycetales bacterium]|nr:efflux RND transporter permease subunit [Planctomycetales bacterium]